MDRSRLTELQTILHGVDLPAERRRLVAYAAKEGAEADMLAQLRQLRSGKFKSIDEVAEAISPVQPRRSAETQPPRTKSGAPPGGDAYVRSS